MSWVLSAIILIAIFLIGFQLGRLSLRQQMLELEETAKSTGWWNMQLENEIEELKKDKQDESGILFRPIPSEDNRSTDNYMDRY